MRLLPAMPAPLSLFAAVPAIAKGAPAFRRVGYVPAHLTVGYLSSASRGRFFSTVARLPARVKCTPQAAPLLSPARHRYVSFLPRKVSTRDR